MMKTTSTFYDTNLSIAHGLLLEPKARQSYFGSTDTVMEVVDVTKISAGKSGDAKNSMVVYVNHYGDEIENNQPEVPQNGSQ